MSNIIETFLKTFPNEDDYLTISRSELLAWKYNLQKDIRKEEKEMETYYKNKFKK